MVYLLSIYTYYSLDTYSYSTFWDSIFSNFYFLPYGNPKKNKGCLANPILCGITNIK